MNIKISKAEKLAKVAIIKLGFSEDDTSLIARNLIEAELAEKKTHGLIRIPALKKNLTKVNTKNEPAEIIKETSTSLHLNGNYKPGFIVIYESLEKAIQKVKISGIVSVGLKDLGYASGYIGAYARIATEKELIFIGFNNSPGGLIPYGSKKESWGTNPLTIGVPSNLGPIILDMASSMTTWGDLLVTKQSGKKLREGTALDENGNPTTDPDKAMAGGILPIAGHKGSGLAFIVELLAGALTGSRVGYSVKGGWGSFYILLDPTVFRPLNEFKNDISTAIKELKNLPRAEGISEIYFAGEKSDRIRTSHLKSGEIEVDDRLLDEISSM